MINKALAFLARIAVGKHLVAGLAGIHNALAGRRSELNLGILALIQILKLAGLLDGATADDIQGKLLLLLPVTLADKAAKVRDTLATLVPEAPKDDAPK